VTDGDDTESFFMRHSTLRKAVVEPWQILRGFVLERRRPEEDRGAHDGNPMPEELQMCRERVRISL